MTAQLTLLAERRNAAALSLSLTHTHNRRVRLQRQLEQWIKSPKPRAKKRQKKTAPPEPAVCSKLLQAAPPEPAVELIPMDVAVELVTTVEALRALVARSTANGVRPTSTQACTAAAFHLQWVSRNRGG